MTGPVRLQYTAVTNRPRLAQGILLCKTVIDAAQGILAQSSLHRSLYGYSRHCCFGMVIGTF